MRSILLPLVLVAMTTAGVLAGVERGNRLFRAGKYAEAVEVYRAAIAEGEESPVVHYNLGTALLHLGRYAEAEEHLRAALDVVEPETREWVYYNLGQRFLEDARDAATTDAEARRALYDAAVEAYRQALRLSPEDEDARWNYELALRERDEQQAGGGGGGQEDQQEEEPQPGDAGQGGSASGTSQPSQQEPADAGQGAPGPLSQEQAERILSAVEQDERELFQDKLRKGRQRTQTTRDW